MDSQADYNGWRNYATWVLHVWLTNDEFDYSACLRTVQDARRHAPDAVRAYVADALKENLRELSPLDSASVYTDLLGWAIDSVDFYEIADAFIEAVDEVGAVT